VLKEKRADRGPRVLKDLVFQDYGDRLAKTLNQPLAHAASQMGGGVNER
jgi:hypothetical protein